MSDEQLLVTLGIENKGATTQINKLSQELRYLDKEFKTTSQGSKEFEKTQEGLKTKLTYLEQKYEANNAKLNAYKKQLDSAKESAAKKKDELDKLKASEEDNTKAIEKAEKQLDRYQQQMISTTRNINLTEAEMKNLTKEVNSTSLSLENFKADQLKAKMEEMSKSVQSAGTKINGFGQGMSSAGGSLMKISAPIVALTALATKAEIDFETAFTGVRKTVNGTEEQFAELEQGIKDMSKVMPESASNIAKVAESAGQLGIKTESILGFTKTMVMLGDSTNMSADEAATALARLANITQMPQDKFQNLGSTIVALGNNLATTESEITEMGLRLAGAGKQIGLTEPQILSIAGALSSVGIEAEAGGSSFSKVMVDMQLAVEKGGDSLNNFASVAGVSSSQFQQAFKQDAAGALISFVTGLQNTEKNGSSAIKVLDDMGITEVRMRDALLRAAGAGDTFSNSIKIGTEAWNENNALTNEAGKRYETTASKIEMLKNKFKAVGIELGENLLPYVTELMEGLSDLAEWFGSLDKGTQETIVKMGLLTFATGGLLKGLGSVTQGIGSIVTVGGKGIDALSNLVKSTDKLEKASKAASVGGIGKLETSMLGLNPITVSLGIGLAAVGTSIAASKTYYDLLSGSITQTTDDMSDFEKVVANFSGVQKYSTEQLKEMGILYKDFSGNITDDTKQALTDTATKFRELQFEIDRIDLGAAITDEEKQNLVTKVDELCQTILTQLDGVQSESYSKLKKSFEVDGIIDESEQKILDSMNKAGEDIKNKVSSIQQELKQLEESGALNTEQGRQQLHDKLLQLQDLYSQQTLAKEEANAQDMETFKQQANSLNLENAKATMSEQAKLRNEELEKTRSNYDDSIALLQGKLSTCSGEEAKYYQEQIDKLSGQKEKELEIANQKYDGYLEVIDEKYPKIMENINKYTGEKLNEEDKVAQKELDKLKSHYEGINEITASGNQVMYDNTTNTWKDVGVTVDENTGEITGIYDAYAGKVGGYTENIAESLRKNVAEHASATMYIEGALNDMSGSTMNSAGQIVDSNGRIITSLNNVTNNMDGTRTGILNLNGTPITINADANDAITNLDEVKGKIDDVKKRDGTDISIKATVKTFFEKIGDWLGFADGTDNAPAGVAFVAEEGQELILDGNRALLTGSSGAQLYNFSGGETVYTADETKKILANRQVSGGYFSPDSIESSQLISNVNNSYSNVTNNTNNNGGLNMELMANMMATALANAMSNVTLKSNVILNENAVTGMVGNNFAMSRKRVR